MRLLRRRTGMAGVALFAAALTMPLMAGPAGAGGGGGCHKGATDGSGSVVTIHEACFGPTVTRVPVGTQVTWTNKDPYPHVVAGDQWGSPDDLQQGDRYSTVFRSRGVYAYTCYIHPGMVGAVIVGDAVASDVGAGDLNPISDSGLDADAAASKAAAKTLSTRPAAVKTSAGAWPVTTAIGFGLAFALGIGLLLTLRRLHRGPEGRS